MSKSADHGAAVVPILGAPTPASAQRPGIDAPFKAPPGRGGGVGSGRVAWRGSGRGRGAGRGRVAAPSVAGTAQAVQIDIVDVAGVAKAAASSLDDASVVRLRKKRLNLTGDVLCGPGGLRRVLDTFPSIPLKGRGHELGDLRRILTAYESWSNRLFAPLPFDEFLVRTEKLGSNGLVKNQVERMRFALHAGRRQASDDEGEAAVAVQLQGIDRRLDGWRTLADDGQPQPVHQHPTPRPGLQSTVQTDLSSALPDDADLAALYLAEPGPIRLQYAPPSSSFLFENEAAAGASATANGTLALASVSVSAAAAAVAADSAAAAAAAEAAEMAEAAYEEDMAVLRELECQL